MKTQKTPIAPEKSNDETEVANPERMVDAMFTVIDSESPEVEASEIMEVRIEGGEWGYDNNQIIEELFPTPVASRGMATARGGGTADASKTVEAFKVAADQMSKMTKALSSSETDALLKLSKNLGAIAGGLGVLGAGLNFIINISEPSDTEKILGAIDKLDKKLDTISDSIDQQFDKVMDKINLAEVDNLTTPVLSELGTLKTNIHMYWKYNASGRTMDLQSHIDNHLKNINIEKIQGNFDKIYNNVVGGSISTSGVFMAHYDFHCGDLRGIYKLGGVIVDALQYAIIGELLVTSLTNGETKAQIDSNIRTAQDFYGDRLNKVIDEWEKVLDMCKNHMKSNIDKFLTKHIWNKLTATDNAGISRELYKKLSAQWNWCNWFVAVYDSCGGYNNHVHASTDSNYYNFYPQKQEDKNIVLKWIDKNSTLPYRVPSTEFKWNIGSYGQGSLNAEDTYQVFPTTDFGIPVPITISGQKMYQGLVDKIEYPGSFLAVRLGNGLRATYDYGSNVFWKNGTKWSVVIIGNSILPPAENGTMRSTKGYLTWSGGAGANLANKLEGGRLWAVWNPHLQSGLRLERAQISGKNYIKRSDTGQFLSWSSGFKDLGSPRKWCTWSSKSDFPIKIVDGKFISTELNGITLYLSWSGGFGQELGANRLWAVWSTEKDTAISWSVLGV